MIVRTPQKITLANLPTPLRYMERLSQRFPGKSLWLKSDDQSGFTLSGNKVRKLEFLLFDALEKNCDTVITCGGIQSNHCRATAFACAQLGLNCHLILRNDLDQHGNVSAGQANHFLAGLCGASIELHTQVQYARTLNDLFADAEARLRIKGRQPYAIPVGGSNALGVWGYIAAIAELKQQCEAFDIEPDIIVCATGSGGTQAGLTLGVVLEDMTTEVLSMAVCDSKEYFAKKVSEDIRLCCENTELSPLQIDDIMRRVRIQTNDNYIGPGYALADREVYQTIADLARLEGVLLDPVYTGKAMHGLLSELSRGQLAHAETIVFMHTGGAFGLFPHARAFGDFLR